jgi:periplasmic divalent cation tolerance protein
MTTPDAPAGTHLVAFTTAPTAEAARALVTKLVEQRIVACGAVEQQDEVLVVLKTTAQRWPELAAALPGLHPYEVPELVAMPVVGGHPAYLQWVSDETVEPGTRKE